MTLTPNLIACLAIGGAGILTALLSIPFFRHTGMLRRKCSARTTGTVVRYRLQRRGSGCGTSIAPVVEFQAAGEIYTACRHYKGIAVSKKVIPISDGTAGELWRLGSTLPVVYDPKNPKRAYVEHVVSTAGVAGGVLLCVGVGLLVLAALGVVLF